MVAALMLVLMVDLAAAVKDQILAVLHPLLLLVQGTRQAHHHPKGILVVLVLLKVVVAAVELMLLAGQEHQPQQVLAGMELHQQFLVLA